GGGVGAVERVEEGGVEGAEGEFVYYVGEVESLVVSVVVTGAPSYPRRPLKLLLFVPAHLPQHVPHMCILLFLPHVLGIRQLMSSLHSSPITPIGWILRQEIASEDAIAAGVLDVDVEVMAEHGDNDIEVDLQLMGDTLLNGEEVGFMAAIPAEKFTKGEEEGDEDQDEGCLSAKRSDNRKCVQKDENEDVQKVDGDQFVRKASNVLIPSRKPPAFSVKALSSRPWSAKPFMFRKGHRSIIDAEGITQWAHNKSWRIILALQVVKD
ncbi:MAG: hypothetical protein Q9218_007904, partial [Villophora microphyllina]